MKDTGTVIVPGRTWYEVPLAVYYSRGNVPLPSLSLSLHSIWHSLNSLLKHYRGSVQKLSDIKSQLYSDFHLPGTRWTFKYIYCLVAFKTIQSFSQGMWLYSSKTKNCLVSKSKHTTWHLIWSAYGSNKFSIQP